MKPLYVVDLFKYDAGHVASLVPQELKKDALELAEQSEFDFDYAEVKTVYVKGGE